MLCENLEQVIASDKPCNCIQIAYNSEWAIRRFFGAIREKEMQKMFKLMAVCGVQKNQKEAINNLLKAFIENGSSEEEKENARYLEQQIESRKIRYYHVNGNCSLPTEVYGSSIQAAIIHSKNTTHLKYIIDATINRLHVLCEKPLVPVLDENGKPTDKYIKQLEFIARVRNERILMDAEHYAYKKSSVIFYENLEEILKDETGKRKIKRIEGELLEIDNPYKWRTVDVLSIKNQTGLLGDTMVHLLSFISNLHGKAIPIKREYDCFQDDKVKYDVDTYDNVEYAVKNTDRDYFTEDCQAYLTVAKFIDRAGKPESKKIKFVLDDGSEVNLDFKTGGVTKTKNSETKQYHEKSIVSSNEYTNILNHFYYCIFTNSRPLTSFETSLLKLKAIYESYKIGKKVNFYK